MKTKLIAPLFLFAMFSQGCIIVSDDADSSLTIYNDSNFALSEIYIADSYDVGGSWGPNLLGSEPLDPDEEITISLECGTYDVEVVDIDGFVCNFWDYELCFDDDIWFVQCGPQLTSAHAEAVQANESTASSESTTTL